MDIYHLTLLLRRQELAHEEKDVFAHRLPANAQVNPFVWSHSIVHHEAIRP